MEKIYELELHRGNDIKSCLDKFITSKGWNSAYIMGGIGSVEDIVLSNPISKEFPPNIETQNLSGPCEVLSFTGEIMNKEFMSESMKKVYKDDECQLFIHIHMSCSTAGGRVFGGGLHNGKIFRGMKLYIKQM